jgi:hypothetical protein
MWKIWKFQEVMSKRNGPLFRKFQAGSAQSTRRDNPGFAIGFLIGPFWLSERGL